MPDVVYDVAKQFELFDRFSELADKLRLEGGIVQNDFNREPFDNEQPISNDNQVLFLQRMFKLADDVRELAYGVIEILDHPKVVE